VLGYGYSADGLSTEHYSGWRHNTRFSDALAAGLDTIKSRRPNLRIDWRVYICCWAAENGLRLDGDFLECGVFTGIYSRAILEYTKTDRKFWLLDTFTGIDHALLTAPERFNTRMNRKYDGDCFEEVKETFSQFPNVKLVKGSVPATLDQVTSDKLAYVSIDMNAAYPEVQAAKFAWPRMSNGAMMLFDDYGFRAHATQREMLDQWAEGEGVSILALPTGQGLVVK